MVPDDLDAVTRKEVNELADVMKQPGVDQARVAAAIVADVSKAKEEKRFEARIKGEQAVEVQQKKEKVMEEQLGAAHKAVEKAKITQLRRIEEIEEEKQTEVDLKKKVALETSIAEKQVAREESIRLKDAQQALVLAKEDLIREEKSLAEVTETRERLTAELSKAELDNDAQALSSVKQKMAVSTTLEEGARANIATFKKKVAVLQSQVDVMEENTVARLHKHALQSQKQLDTIDSDQATVKRDIAAAQAKENDLAMSKVQQPDTPAAR